MLYKNALVLNREFIFEKKDININCGVIGGPEAVESSIDGMDYAVIPALTDIHTHGACGRNFNDGAKASGVIDEYMRKNGIFGYLQTLVTSDIENMIGLCAGYADYKAKHNTLADGLYLEGPFISKAKKGCHNEKNILNPDIELFKRMYDASQGLIKVITVAPELPDAIPFIKQVSKVCRVAIGHSMADYDTALRAFDAGATSVTHLFNAMGPLEHRAPGIAAAARDRGAYVELICDGIHIHPAVIRLVFSGFEKEKIILVSDTISATGLEDGEYTLGGLKTIVKDQVSRLEDGTLAGSTTNLLNCVKKAVEFGIKLEDAVRAASYNPCSLIGRENNKVIILDKNLNLVVNRNPQKLKK